MIEKTTQVWSHILRLFHKRLVHTKFDIHVCSVRWSLPSPPSNYVGCLVSGTNSSWASGFTSRFWWGPCYSSLLFFCVVLFVLFVFVLCLVFPMLPVFLNCPFLIALSVSLTFICIMKKKNHTTQTPTRYFEKVDFACSMHVICREA
jgi:hypothetical protein